MTTKPKQHIQFTCPKTCETCYPEEKKTDHYHSATGSKTVPVHPEDDCPICKAPDHNGDVTEMIPKETEAWEKRFDKKFIMPEDHLGKKYWQGGYTPQVWGKYRDMKEVKAFIAKERTQVAEAERKKVVRELLESIENKFNGEELLYGEFLKIKARYFKRR